MQAPEHRNDPLTRAAAGQQARRGAYAAWQIREDDYPLRAPMRQKLLLFLRYAILAPSLYNSQPWLFRVGEDVVDVIVDPQRRLRIADPDGREAIMSCGAVVSILRTAAAYFGHETTLTAFPESTRAEVVARVRVEGTFVPGAEDRARFKAVPTRRRNVVCFDCSPPSSSLLDTLAERARRFGVRLTYIDQPELKEETVRLISEADRLQMSDPAFRAELAQWTHEESYWRADGIPSNWHQGASSLADFGAPVWSQALGRNGPVDYRIAQTQQRVGSPPLLGLLATETDTSQDWLAAGQALLETELQARAASVWLTDFNQPIQVSKTRARLRRLAEVGYPQALVRIGYGAEVAPTPRRSLECMLLNG